MAHGNHNDEPTPSDQDARFFLEDGHKWAGQTSKDYAPREDKVDTAIERGIVARLTEPKGYATRLEHAIDSYREAFAAAPPQSDLHAEARQAFQYKLRESLAFNGQIAAPAPAAEPVVKPTKHDVIVMNARPAASHGVALQRTGTD